MKKTSWAFLAVVALATFAVRANAGNCVGSCGVENASDGVVTLPPAGTGYGWVSTTNGIDDVGGAPGVAANFTNGSTYTTSTFFLATGSDVVAYYNYITTDGDGFPDSAYAELYAAGGIPVALLFSAQTTPSGSTVPGYTVTGGPVADAMLTPASVDLGLQDGPAFSKLGIWSGTCWTAPGCGYSGWVRSDYTVASTGSYFIVYGVANSNDMNYDSALAWSTTPEPGTLLMLGSGMLGIGGVLRRKLTL